MAKALTQLKNVMLAFFYFRFKILSKNALSIKVLYLEAETQQIAPRNGGDVPTTPQYLVCLRIHVNVADSVLGLPEPENPFPIHPQSKKRKAAAAPLPGAPPEKLMKTQELKIALERETSKIRIRGKSLQELYENIKIVEPTFDPETNIIEFADPDFGWCQLLIYEDLPSVTTLRIK